jgi:hypothetical protein
VVGGTDRQAIHRRLIDLAPTYYRKIFVARDISSTIFLQFHHHQHHNSTAASTTTSTTHYSLQTDLFDFAAEEQFHRHVLTYF